MRSLSILLPCFLLPSCSFFLGGTAINLHGGLRELSSETATISDMQVYGLEGTVALGGSVGVEGAVFVSEEEGDNVGGFEPELDQGEISLGVRYTFLENMPVRIYVGGGVNWIDAELDGLPSAPESDDSAGGYAHAGVLFNVFSFQAGVDVRGSITGTEIGGEDLDYLQGTIFIGIGF